MSGGKAAGLRALSAVAPVPAFFVIEADATIESDRIFADLDAAGVREPFAVRSSADIEDGGESAFAGMFSTCLRVLHRDLIGAVWEVRASVDSPRVRAYAAVRGERANANMAVIIQNMVDARVAGVCASRLPESGTDVITVESVWGLGETLVDGTATPDVAYIDRRTKHISRGSPGNQVVALTLDAGKALVRPHLRKVAKLTDSELLEIAEVALAVERLLGWPAVDLEWAFDCDQLWALQARPVTSVGRPRADGA